MTEKEPRLNMGLNQKLLNGYQLVQDFLAVYIQMLALYAS